MPKSSKKKVEIPTDEMLVAAISAIRIDNPTMGREKLKLKLQRENQNWEITGPRFKQILLDHHLDTEETQKQRETLSTKPRDKSFTKVIKSAFEEYREHERAFLLGLSKKERYALDSQEPTLLSKTHLKALERMNGKPSSKNDPRIYQRKSLKPKWFFAARMRFHFQILMTLMGLKPVTLFSHPKFSGMAVLQRMVEQCFLPIFKKYKLEAYGFTLQKIEHPMFVKASPGFQGAMVFADLRLDSPLLNEAVQEIFFTFHPGKIISEVDIARLLGYPMSGGPGLPVVRYKDMSEMALLWKAIGKDSGGSAEEFFVVGLEYYRGREGVHKAACQTHFSRWAEIAKSVGVVIMFD